MSVPEVTLLRPRADVSRSNLVESLDNRSVLVKALEELAGAGEEELSLPGILA
jgi:hypothetical protein